MSYLAFNLCLGPILIIVGFSQIRGREQLMVVVRTALGVTMLCFPWEFFAINLSVWSYNDPGYCLFNVPINDLVFIFYCSFFSTSILTKHRFRLSKASPSNR